ncbi:2-hydroxychromene-2-carboxylate isomerase [Candidatus Phycosocius bacilliformis]|uniref:2-hydroxychromene-2-carboxylate isomerase n=1 Tax=Candidatus Phycosocius bacilliformis TaxID=1445552 RepID=A0A2P2EE25_9PROT|nr:DsbA family protein [Candidatus Phycosocius bacilliformis]GBF59306.1 2-hydroxychromene-2-carboxylate isomerase [Candidatus Phycosocius bacilliformis]
MSLKAFVVSRVAEAITSQKRLDMARDKAEQARQRQGNRHRVDYFHQIDDPYSHLALQALAVFVQRYDVDVSVFLVGPPDDWAAPERDRLIAYARADCARLARRAGLSFYDPGQQPNPSQVKAAQQAFFQALGTSDFWARATAISADLWAGRIAEVSSKADADPCARGDAERRRLGHFMSAMLHYGGEWYWGLDRLHYLETRLAKLGARRMEAPTHPILAPPEPELMTHAAVGASRRELHWYLSFRSPYTYLATTRVKALADAHGADLRLRFVLPMVMRGLPVPPMKSRYFTLDTAREARRLGVPFGRIADPVGKPVERGYAILPWARDQGRGFEFVEAFMTAVWSQGVDAGSDSGMARIVESAGLNWDEARRLLTSQAWREEAEANRLELLNLGHWGVPCFRVGDVCVWGQDRLWVMDEALRGAS